MINRITRFAYTFLYFDVLFLLLFLLMWYKPGLVIVGVMAAISALIIFFCMVADLKPDLQKLSFIVLCLVLAVAIITAGLFNNGFITGKTETISFCIEVAIYIPFFIIYVIKSTRRDGNL